jgi:uncharacterized protein YjiS (DUF1127 family)
MRKIQARQRNNALRAITLRFSSPFKEPPDWSPSGAVDMCTTIDDLSHWERHEVKSLIPSTSSHDWLSLLKVWVQRSRERNDLTELLNNDRLLNDIGVSRLDAIREARKPFWRS